MQMLGVRPVFVCKCVSGSCNRTCQEFWWGQQTKDWANLQRCTDSSGFLFCITHAIWGKLLIGVFVRRRLACVVWKVTGSSCHRKLQVTRLPGPGVDPGSVRSFHRPSGIAFAFGANSTTGWTEHYSNIYDEPLLSVTKPFHAFQSSKIVFVSNFWCFRWFSWLLF